MHGLGRPIRVCTRHVGPLDCPRGCLGVHLDDVAELQAATHTGCAVCRLPQPRSFGSRPFKALRKCHRRRCYGCFRKDPIDDLGINEWLDLWHRRIRLITRLLSGKYDK